MSNLPPDDNLPPLPPSDDHGAPSRPAELSGDAPNPVLGANSPDTRPALTAPTHTSVNADMKEDVVPQPAGMPLPATPSPLSSPPSQPPTLNKNPLKKEDEPIIGAPKQNEIPQEADFPGQPVPESEQVKLEQKAEEIVGETSASKAKKSKRLLQVVVGVFAFLILGGGVLVGTNLVQIPGVGDVRQQAAMNQSCYDNCREVQGKGHLVCQCNCGGECLRPDQQENPQSCTDPTPGNCQFPCGGCGGFCGDAGVACGKTCNEQIAEKQAAGQCQGDGVQYGANFVAGANQASCQTGYQSAWCDCNGAAAGGGYCFSRGFNSQCGELCPLTNNPNPTASGPPNGSTTIYFCENQFNMGNGCQGRVINSIPNCYCGTIQVDTVGAGFTSYESHCGCDTSTPPPTTPPPPTLACTGMSSVPANPKLGDSVRYTCTGTAGVARINHYGFQYKVGNGAFTALAASAAGSSQSAPLVISEPGSYTVRCRVCLSTDDTNCTAWQTL